MYHRWRSSISMYSPQETLFLPEEDSVLGRLYMYVVMPATDESKDHSCRASALLDFLFNSHLIQEPYNTAW